MELEILLNKNMGDTLNAEEQQFVNEIKDYVYKLINNKPVDEYNYDKTYAYAKLGKLGIIEEDKKRIDFIFETILYNGLYDKDTDTLFKTYPILLEYVDNVLDALDLSQLEALSSYYYSKKDYKNYYNVCIFGANYRPRGLLGGFKLVNALIKIDSFKAHLAFCLIYGTGTEPKYAEAFRIFLNYRIDHLVYKNGADIFTDEDLTYLYSKIKEDYEDGKRYPGLFYSLAVMNREGIGTNYSPEGYKKYLELGLQEFEGKDEEKMSDIEYTYYELFNEYRKNWMIDKYGYGVVINDLCDIDNIQVGKFIELGKYNHRSILWKVLDIKNDKALLLSSHILENFYPIKNIGDDLIAGSLRFLKRHIKIEDGIKYDLKFLNKTEVKKYLRQSDQCYGRTQAYRNGPHGWGLSCPRWLTSSKCKDDYGEWYLFVDYYNHFNRVDGGLIEDGLRPAMWLDLTKDEE